MDKLYSYLDKIITKDGITTTVNVVFTTETIMQLGLTIFVVAVATKVVGKGIDHLLS